MDNIREKILTDAIEAYFESEIRNARLIRVSMLLALINLALIITIVLFML